MYDLGKLTAWVDLSTKCNAKCPQCHRTDRRGLMKVDWLEETSWSLSDFKKAFPKESLGLYENFQFCGTWGDPLMNKDLSKILKYLIDNSTATMEVNTNGSLMSEEWFWDLGKYCGDRLLILFCIDGCDQETHERYRQNTKLEKVLSNMRTLAMTNARTCSFTVVFKHNENEIYDIAEMAKENGADDVIFIPSNRFYLGSTNFPYFKNGVEINLEKIEGEKDLAYGRFHGTDDASMEKLKRLLDEKQ